MQYILQSKSNIKSRQCKAGFTLRENLDDPCGNYRSDYLVDAAVYTGDSRPIVSLVKAGYHIIHKNKLK